MYLPGLKNTEVLLAAIREGVQSMWWERETFAYVDSYDVERNRYLGLKAGQEVQVTLNTTSVLVKPDVAAAQIAADTQATAARREAAKNYAGEVAKPGPVVSERVGTNIIEPMTGTAAGVVHVPSSHVTPLAQEKQVHRFYGSVKINPRVMAGDAGKIMEEVVKHLTTLFGAHVQVTLEIQAHIPGVVPEETVRTVTENCRTLRFDGFGFEQE